MSSRSCNKKECLTLSERYYCSECRVEMVVLTNTASKNKMHLAVDMVASDGNLINQLSTKDAEIIYGMLSSRKYLKTKILSEGKS